MWWLDLCCLKARNYQRLGQRLGKTQLEKRIKSLEILDIVVWDPIRSSLILPIKQLQKITFASVQFSSVQSLSRVQLFATPWITARQASLSITNSRSSLRLNVHWVSDAIQPSHPLSSPSPLAPNPSHHQSLFLWVNSSHEVATVLEFQLQHHSFQRNPRADLLQNGLVGSPCSPRDSQKSSP